MKEVKTRPSALITILVCAFLFFFIGELFFGNFVGNKVNSVLLSVGDKVEDLIDGSDIGHGISIGDCSTIDPEKKIDLGEFHNNQVPCTDNTARALVSSISFTEPSYCTVAPCTVQKDDVSEKWVVLTKLPAFGVCQIVYQTTANPTKSKYIDCSDVPMNIDEAVASNSAIKDAKEIKSATVYKFWPQLSEAECSAKDRFDMSKYLWFDGKIVDRSVCMETLYAFGDTK